MGKSKTDAHPAATLTTSAKRAVNEWGIPDWRDAAAYGDVKYWGFHRWRWEFYRRRDDLREYFDARADAAFQSCLAEFSSDPASFPDGRVRRPDEPGFCITVDLWAQPKLGYCALGNPRIGAQPVDIVWPYDGDGKVSFTNGDMPDTFGGALETAKLELEPLQEFILAHWKDRHGIELAPHECAVNFDLTRPLEAQLATARKLLRAEQARLCGKPMQRRRHREKWLGYLRTLDARADGASWAEIAELHPFTTQTAQNARDIWEAADALRFNF